MARKSKKVTIPRTYKSGPNSHRVKAIYATEPEIGLLRALDMHNSGIGTENHYGPGGLLNMDGGGAGDPIGRKVASTSAGRRLVQSATQPTRTFVAPTVPAKTRPAASVYAGPGYRTEPADLITAGDIRKELAAPYVQTIQATTDFEYSDPWGRDRDQDTDDDDGDVVVITTDDDDDDDDEDPNGNGKKKTNGNGNGTKKVIKEVVNESGDSPFFDIFSPYRNEERYTGPTVLQVDAPDRGLLNYSQWMPPEGVGLREYGPQRAMFANQGANWQPQWQGGGFGYQPPQGVTYAPDYQTVDQPTSGDGTTDSGTTDTQSGTFFGQPYANQGEYVRLLDTHNKAMQLIRGGRNRGFGIGQLMGMSGQVNEWYADAGGTDVSVGNRSASLLGTATTPTTVTPTVTGNNLLSPTGYYGTGADPYLEPRFQSRNIWT